MIDNFATIGKTSLSIYGYGPYNSEISLTGFGVSEKTVSDNKGYFRFERIYSHSFVYPELCLQAKDIQNRLTQPSCIPALPADKQIPLEVGPVLLSPTISIQSNQVVIGDINIVTGVTMPNSKVDVYLATSGVKTLSLVNTVNAYYIPIYQTDSKTDGTYEFSLPTSDVSSNTIFVSGKIGENITNKSNTLTFSVISPTKSQYFSLKEFLLNNKISLFIILELVIIMTLGIMALKAPTRRKKTNKIKV